MSVNGLLCLFLVSCVCLMLPLNSLQSSLLASTQEHLSQAKIIEQEKEGPWLTGPLLTPSPYCMPFGHFNFEPYLFVTKTSHEYNQKWSPQRVPTFVSATFQPSIQLGIAPNFEFDILPSATWNHSRHQAKTVFNDFSLLLAYQLYKGHPNKWYPRIKLYIQETFPTGKFQHLDPTKFGTDIGGVGQYQTQIGLVFGKVWYFGHLHWLTNRFNVSFTTAPKLHVSDTNIYGGVKGTKGIINPGNQVRVLTGFEYTINLNWVLAIDLLYLHIGKDTFHGRKGFIADGIPAAIGLPSSDLFSVAPACEYNWNDSLGIIIGPWITVAGRNAVDFTSYVAALNWYY